MAATRTRSKQSVNGSGAVARAKGAGDSVATAARTAKGPMLAAGATAAGLAGGVALGSKLGSRRTGLSGLLSPRRRVFGVPIGRKSGVIKAGEALGKVARELASARKQASVATDDVHQIREQLEQGNRRSPVEVVLEGLTHRRGAHRQESQR